MLSETSGDFADVPKQPDKIAAANRVSNVADNLSFFMFLLCRTRTECGAVVNRWLAGLAFAAFMSAMAIDVWCLFHGLARGTAILTGGCRARTNGVRALLFFCRGHYHFS